MVNYEHTRVKLTNTKLSNLKSAAKNKNRNNIEKTLR